MDMVYNTKEQLYPLTSRFILSIQRERFFDKYTA